ncbi:MAG: CBM35 domain-containing protein, partial [Rufibacter sp.]
MVFALGVLQNLFGKPKIATLALLALVLSPLLAEAAEIKLEAENATRNGVTVASTRGGFSGTGYVQGFDNSFAKNVTFSVSVPATG